MGLRWLALLIAGFILAIPTAAFADDDPTPSESPSESSSATVDSTATPTDVTTEEPVKPSGPGIAVTLVNSSDKSKEFPKGRPLEGVTLTVIDSSGAEVGSAVTDATGLAFIPVEALDTYTVELDEDTLPDGINLNGSNQSDPVKMRLMAPTYVDFPIGATKGEKASFGDKLAQSLASGIKFGLIVALAALGLSLIFGTTGLTNFAHGELITLGGVLTYTFNRSVGLPVILAGLVAVLLSAGFGWAQDKGLWAPLRRRGTGLIAMMIVSIGFGLFLRSIFQYIYSSSTKTLSQYTTQGAHDFGIIKLADKEIAIILIATVAIAGVCVAMMKTRMGKAMRAVSDNPALAASSGMRVDSVISTAWVLGTAMSGLAGVLLAVNSQVNFLMGFKLLLLVFAAVTLGGLGTIWGALIGSMIIGIIVEVGPLFGVPSSIKEVGALVVLVLILLVRPQGILGRRERIG
ncbi:branched-chain amino acid ABC transporter permease [Nocardioides humilatus]|uniref:Branched-chain amino acid ABC transporter permease n=1 Tax=Nocardioides humilatus TaxID=2607660 RepID=A0A5B1LB31_9ACTN|nr:branched-chain amino acid ABC transporter permease [Nocardioides humilatus]KAA1417872.1 branched-chain amino acid ABC transporter permease [Nocardioides humilatus]